MNEDSAGARANSSDISDGHVNTAADAPGVDLDFQYMDHYLCRMMPIVLFINHRRVLVNVDQLLYPRDLVHAAVFFHAQRSRRPPPRLPCYMQLKFHPLQLQRFLRSCVLATVHALVTPPANVCRLVHARTRSRCFDCIFVRVMSGFAARAEVRRQATCLSQCKRWHGLAVMSLTHRAAKFANAGGYPGATSGDAGASAALPTVVVFHAHALLVRRLLPPPALQAKTAFKKRHSEATSLLCEII